MAARPQSRRNPARVTNSDKAAAATDDKGWMQDWSTIRRGGRVMRVSVRAVVLVCVQVLAATLLVGCVRQTVTIPGRGITVPVVLDLDPYQKKYRFYYWDPATGRRTPVPQEWIERELTPDTTDGTTDPGPGAWVGHSSVPGAELKKRKVDGQVTLEEKRSTNDGNAGRI